MIPFPVKHFKLDEYKPWLSNRDSSMVSSGYRTRSRNFSSSEKVGLSVGCSAQHLRITVYLQHQERYNISQLILLTWHCTTRMIWGSSWRASDYMNQDDTVHERIWISFTYVVSSVYVGLSSLCPLSNSGFTSLLATPGYGRLPLVISSHSNIP